MVTIPLIGPQQSLESLACRRDKICDFRAAMGFATLGRGQASKFDQVSLLVAQLNQSVATTTGVESHRLSTPCKLDAARCSALLRLHSAA
jgi:hypothetical protein